MLPRTSVVLLLLVIVAELPLTLCRHPTLRLHHLFYFIGATLESLRGIEALNVGSRVHPRIELADRVMTLGHRVDHAWICYSRLERVLIKPDGLVVPYHIRGRGGPSS